MSFQSYNPFENPDLDPGTCFLTGTKLSDPEEKITVFPPWALNRFELRGKKFKMMNQVSSVLYEDIVLPCAADVMKAFEKLETEIQEAFDKGYEAVRLIPEEKFFLWMGKIVYGILYHDLLIEIQRMERKGKKFALSPRLKERYRLFHLMLQSIVSPIHFKGQKPWSIFVAKLKYSKDIFHYRDNPVNLAFSLGLNGFGIVACFQDNGLVKQKQNEILDKIKGIELHPVQFEELCARFMYSNYLLQYKVEYHIESNDEGITITPLPVNERYNKKIFAEWDDQVFAQLLGKYWEVWGFTTQTVVKFPEGTISFLENDCTNELINPMSIELPY